LKKGMAAALPVKERKTEGEGLKRLLSVGGLKGSKTVERNH